MPAHGGAPLVLTVHVRRADGLGSGDSGLPCDPYCIVRAGELKPWRSKTARRTVSPHWDAFITFDGCRPERLPYLSIECWDEDGSSSDDPLALVLLPLLPFLTGLGGREVTVPCGRGLGKCNGLGTICVAVGVVEQFPRVPLDPSLLIAAETFRALVAALDAQTSPAARPLASSVWVAGTSAAPLDEALEAVCHGVSLGSSKANAVACVLYISSCRLLVMPEEAAGGGATAAAAMAAVAPGSAPPAAPTAPPSSSSFSSKKVWPAPLLCLPLHHLLRVEATLASEPSAGSSFLVSRSRSAGSSSSSRGGELQLHCLLGREHTLRFCAARHGSGPASACALVHARLAFHSANLDRRCAPLLAVPSPVLFAEGERDATRAAAARWIVPEAVACASGGSTGPGGKPTARPKKGGKGKKSSGQQAGGGGRHASEDEALPGAAVADDPLTRAVAEAAAEAAGEEEEEETAEMAASAPSTAPSRAVGRCDDHDAPAQKGMPPCAQVAPPPPPPPLPSPGRAARACSPSGVSERCAPWDAFVPDTEWARQRVDATGCWRECHANANHALCGSYPRRLLVPADVTDGALAGSARFRSKVRTPAICR